jgi:hypothetical protein
VWMELFLRGGIVWEEFRPPRSDLR